MHKYVKDKIEEVNNIKLNNIISTLIRKKSAIWFKKPFDYMKVGCYDYP